MCEALDACIVLPFRVYECLQKVIKKRNQNGNTVVY